MAEKKTRFDEFEDFLRSIDAATHARIDALVDDPDYEPPKVELFKDEDPFGMDWAWLNEPDESDSKKGDESNSEK